MVNNKAMTPIEEAIRKILQSAMAKSRDPVPALVEMVERERERAHAEAIRMAAESPYIVMVYDGGPKCFMPIKMHLSKDHQDQILAITPTLARLQQQKREQEMVLGEHVNCCQICFVDTQGTVMQCGHRKRLETALAALDQAIEAEKGKVGL